MYTRKNTKLSFNIKNGKKFRSLSFYLNKSAKGYTYDKHKIRAAKFDLNYSLCLKIPALRSVSGLTEASKILFGVKTLTDLVKNVDSQSADRLNAFFGDDKSSLVAWGSVCNHSIFYALPEHKSVYKRMIRDLGLNVAVRLTQASDFADMIRAFEFVRNTPKRWAKFQATILPALARFPSGTHVKLVHDYAMKAMQAAEQKSRPGVVVSGRSLPVPSLHLAESALTVEENKYQILVPSYESDLRRIGTAQGHCVGTRQMGYADRILKGSVHIIALYKKTLADGICLEICTRTGQLLQAQGKHRRQPTQAEYLLIDNIRNSIQPVLKIACQIHR